MQELFLIKQAFLYYLDLQWRSAKILLALLKHRVVQDFLMSQVLTQIRSFPWIYYSSGTSFSLGGIVLIPTNADIQELWHW